MIDAFLDDFEENESLERWLGTFAWDEGITSERIPDVDIISLRGKVDKAMREYGLEGIGVVEVDVLTPIAGEKGRLLLFHVHVYCWTSDGSKFDHTGAAGKLMKTRRFPNRLGAPSVKFRSVSRYEISVARIAGYFTKFQPGAKNRIPRRNKPGSYVLRSTFRGFTPDSVVRLVEVMSHLDARDVVFSVGSGGRELRDRWYGKFMAWARRRDHPTARSRTDAQNDVAARWCGIRAGNGSKKLKPCRIITRVEQR